LKKRKKTPDDPAGVKVVLMVIALSQDIVNKYAKDMMAAKYRIAVIMVRTILSDAWKACIFFMQIGFWVKNLILPVAAGARQKNKRTRFRRVGSGL
jgi:hypothetical protein